MALTVNSAAAERRVALVVGASHYAHASTLAKTLNDANDVAAALKKLNFEVDLVLDPIRSQLENAVRRFGESAAGADVSLFYYSGHALESHGINWILPISAQINSERDLRFEAFDLATVLEQTDGLSRISLVFLDACRNDPFKQRLGSTRELNRSGLADVRAVTGSFIAFAAAPGMVANDGTGRNSPFTGAILKHIDTDGLEIRQLMSRVRSDVEAETNGKQVTWDSSSLKGDFYFRQDKLLDSPGRKVQLNEPQIDLDRLFWDSIRNSRNPKEFNAYLQKFPQGIFAELARSRLVELNASIEIKSPADIQLQEALAKVLPSVADKTRHEIALAYHNAKQHKSIAVYPASGSSFHVSARSSAQEAEENGLEACEVYVGAPCHLIAVDDVVSPDAVPAHPMPRVHYSGRFDPSQIPSVQTAVRHRADVVNYASTPSAKAVVYHPTGKLFVAFEASQRAAEEQALSICNNDPARNGRDGPCYLYASGNEVVLPRRAKVAITPASAEVVAAPTIVEHPSEIKHDDLILQLDRSFPAMTGPMRENIAKVYLVDRVHKALAFHPSGSWRTSGWPSAAAAEEAVLEGCQGFYGTPCIMVALDNTLYPLTDGTTAARDMPRIHYSGPFDPEKVPYVTAAVRSRSDIRSYSTAPVPKAAAFHPWGSLYTVTGGKTQEGVEAEALAQCNGDKARKGGGGPCYLYASGNLVVFGKRQRSPITPAPAVVPQTPPPVATKPSPSAERSALKDGLFRAISSKQGGMAGARQVNLEALTDAFLAANGGHRALAAGRETLGIAIEQTVLDQAKLLALERCQLASDLEPCSLIAVDHQILPVSADNKWPLQDMRRIHFDGVFDDPSQPPGLADAERKRADVIGYARSPFPKAAALSSDGEIFIATGAKNQHEAEEQTMSQCARRYARRCYLYAVGNEVILQRRLTQPRSAGDSLAEVLSYLSVRSGNSEQRAQNFYKLKTHRSWAFVPETGSSFSWGNVSNVALAEQLALESCGLRYNSRCMTLVRDDKILVKDFWTAPRQTMQRLVYRGPFRPAMIPLFSSPPDAASEYARLKEPKAVAIRPDGTRFKIATGRTLLEAQQKALKDCNEDESAFPCFVYAINENVILPDRRTEARP